jgi:hypothetical protein
LVPLRTGFLSSNLAAAGRVRSRSRKAVVAEGSMPLNSYCS